MGAMNNAILAAGATLLGIGLVCLAALPFTEPAWQNLAELGIILGFLAVGIVALTVLAYPLAKAEADVKRCKGCDEETGGDA